MKQRFYWILCFIACCQMACVTNSITGRKQLSLVSDSELRTLSLTQYKEFLTANKVIPAGNPEADMVKRVAGKVVAAVKQFYADKGQPHVLDDYQWEFNLVESKEVNAWCMPGGKVVVYNGILPITKDETALAIVLGHEITHAVVGHGKERMSQEMVAQGIGGLGSAALGTDPKTVNIFNQAYGVSAQYGVLLPNSRKQELEADHFGLIFAAAAGYDPQKAVEFWTRMASLSNGQQTPAFLSDHPSDDQRIQKIKELLPEALTYYHPK